MVTALGSCVKWPYVVCSALIVCTRCVSVLIVFLDCANVRASGGAIKRSTWFPGPRQKLVRGIACTNKSRPRADLSSF